jgi:two-component system sensor histidine kinase RegB
MSEASSQPDRLTDPVRQDPKPWDIVGGRRGLRLTTLSMMGWRALAGEIVVLLVAWGFLHVQLPILACVVIVAAGVALNVALRLISDRDSPDGVGTAVLCLTIIQVAALLYFTGGVANPFAVMLIAPPVLAAATSNTRHALTVVLFALVAILLLTFWHDPLPWLAGEGLILPPLYVRGCAWALGAGVGFTAAYAWRASVESERMELALNVAHSALAREQRLSDLGALAAAAAHELGTPLATIQIVAKEIVRSGGVSTPAQLKEDAELLVSQAERCREILRRLTEAPQTEDAMHARLGLLQFVNEVVEPHLGGAVRVEGVLSGPPGAQAPEIRRMPEITHALTTLIDNACDFAKSEVLIRARFDDLSIVLEIRDDGPGFAADVLAKLGQPYVTSRPQGENSRTKHEGMGLGVFIASTLLERSGAAIRFENAKRGGAVVSIRWPRSTIEAAPLHEFAQLGT